MSRMPAYPETAARPGTGPTHVRWKVLALICIASSVAYLLRTNLSIAGETMMKDLGLSEIQLGMVLSAFAWGYAIFQFPGGIFGDIVGGRRAVTLIVISWGILTLLTGAVPGRSHFSVAAILVMLICLRFLVGVVQAPIFPVTSGRTIADWFPASGWGFPNGLVSTATTLGAAATGPIIVWLINAYGWRWSFFLTAPVSLLIAGLWWWYVRNDPAEHPGVGQEELQLIQRERPAESRKEPKGSWKLTLKNRDILLLTLSYFCTNYLFYLFFNWFFYYLVEIRGFSDQQAGYLTAGQWVIGAAGAAAGGLICDRLCIRFGAKWGYRLLPVPSLILAAVFLLAGASAKNPLFAVVFLSVSFGFTQLTEGAYWAGMISVSGRHSAAACGIMNTGGNAVGGIGALLVPITAAAFGWVVAVGSGCIFAVAGALLWLMVRADRLMADG
jgi:ACS family glucarate transporter-like MFS transporter